MRMFSPPQSDYPPHARPRKSLNQGGIKHAVVLTLGALTAMVSALTGLGAQAAFAPMLTWMFGYAADKAQATAMQFGWAAAVAAVAMLAFRSHAQLSSTANWLKILPDGYVWKGVILFLGATVGAALAARLASGPPPARRLQWSHTLTIGLMLAVLAQATRFSWLDAPHAVLSRSPLDLLLIAVSMGALTQAMGLAGGVLAVPALYYIGGFAAQQAIALSLLVIALASLLPVLGYARRGLVDPVYGRIATVGGLAGGALGGFLLTYFARTPGTQSVLICLFAAVAMFLSARELARAAGSKPRA